MLEYVFAKTKPVIRYIQQGWESPKKMFDEIPTLPCGHKLQSVVFSAKSLRQDAEDAKKLHDLKFSKRYDDDDYLDTYDDLK